jgi:hypothetical protein
MLCPRVGFGRYARVEVSCATIAGSWEDEGISQCNSLLKEILYAPGMRVVEF